MLRSNPSADLGVDGNKNSLHHLLSLSVYRLEGLFLLLSAESVKPRGVWGAGPPRVEGGGSSSNWGSSSSKRA